MKSAGTDALNVKSTAFFIHNKSYLMHDEAWCICLMLMAQYVDSKRQSLNYLSKRLKKIKYAYVMYFYTYDTKMFLKTWWCLHL